MSARERARREFLARAGWGGAARAPLAGDASARRYERLARGGESAVLMDAPPREAVAPFVAVARQLRRMGYSAPEIRAADEARGFVLMEDFGDESFAALLAGGADAALERRLYEAATDLLIDLRTRPAPAALPRYDGRWMLDDAALFLESATADGGRADAAMARSFAEAWREPLEAAAAAPAGFCFRDFHAGNLMWLPARGGVRRVGLLDFQDARIAPFAYDLVSLLQDARRDLAPRLAAAMVARYLRRAPERDAAAFHATCAILGAQRSLRIAGVFARLARRDGKRRYLAHLPRVWDTLAMNLAHPALAPVRTWIDTWLPERAQRRMP